MKKALFFSFLALFLAYPVSASARELKGTVTEVDTESSSFLLSYTNPEDLADEEAEVVVRPDTQYSGIETFSDLEDGQEVLIDATYDGSGGWIATALKVLDENSPENESFESGEDSVR